MKKIIIITTIAAIVIGGFIYFVGGITSGSSVIKTYSYAGDVKELINHIKSFSRQNSTVFSSVTDTTGTPKKGFTFYINIELKNSRHDILYSIACASSKGKALETKIELVMAYDKINKVGGYSEKAKDIKPLINIFDTDILTPLRNNQNMKIVPLE